MPGGGRKASKVDNTKSKKNARHEAGEKLVEVNSGSRKRNSETPSVS
jgi:hypothetical protein